MAVTATLSGTVNLADSITGNIALSKVISLIVTGSIQEYAQSFNFGTSPTSVTLPVSPVNFVYIKNLHATFTLTVSWTPNGGASAVIQTLEPGGYLIMGQPTSGAGITALSITASNASTPAEFILLG